MIFNIYRLHPHRFLRCLFLPLISFILVCNFVKPGECKQFFETQSFVTKGRTLAVIPDDLDDSGPAEIIIIRKTGIYPSEQRWISFFYADDKLQYGADPRQQWEVDHDATMFEVGDVAPTPGKEIFFLTARGIRYYARENSGFYDIVSRPLVKVSTATVFPSAGFLPRSRLLSDWQHNGKKMLMVPQFGSFVFYDQNKAGEWQASGRIATVPQTFLHGDQEDDGILKTFSLRMDYRLPRIFTQDFNGDGQADLLLTEQESVFIYPYVSEGQFTQEPAISIRLPGRSPGKVADQDLYFLAIPAEINGDGYTDMILTLAQSTGGFLERKVEVFVFLNQKIQDAPFPDQPDQAITFYGITPGVSVADINGDGFQDLLFSGIELGFWNSVKNLISKEVDVLTSVYLFQSNNQYSDKPDFYTKTEYQLDLTHGIRFNGIWPSLDGDFNGDGYPDLLIARDGKIKIYQTLQGEDIFSNSHRQADVITCPYKHVIDLNRDGLKDLVMYEKKRNGKVSILLNKGQWEGSFRNENKNVLENR